MKRDSLRLYVTINSDGPRTYTFIGPEVRVGRASDNGLSISSQYMSRHHGVIFREGEGWSYRDVESRNGTEYMGGDGQARKFERLPPEPTRLKTGDRLRMGDVLIEVELPKEVMQVWNTDEAMTSIFTPENDSSHLSFVRVLFEAAWRLGQCQNETQAFGVLAQIVEKAVSQVSHLLLLEPERGKPDKLMVSWHWDRNGSSAEEPYFSNTLGMRALRDGQSFLWTPAEVSTESIYQAEISSSVLVPVRGSQGYHGVFQADCRAPTDGSRGLQPVDLHFLTLLGELTAATLDRFRNARRIEEMFDGFVRASVKAIEARDKYTGGHSERVCRYSMLLADAINQNEALVKAGHQLLPDNLLTLRYSALLHDLGKVGVPEHVLNKPLKLSVQEIQRIFSRFQLAQFAARTHMAETDVELALKGELTPEYRAHRAYELEQALAFLNREKRWLRGLMGNRPVREDDIPRLKRLTEPFYNVVLLSPHQLQTLLACNRTLKPWEWKEMQLHAYKSRQLLQEIPWPCGLERIPQIVGSHHEKLDGSGYFESLSGEALPTEVRILTVCDIYDAVTGIGRRYLREPMSREQAFDLVLWPDAKRDRLMPELVELLYDVTANLPGGGVLTLGGEFASGAQDS